jgi:hypothetical protein
MSKCSEFNTGTASRGDSAYAIQKSTGSSTNLNKFEGPGNKDKSQYGD